MADNEMQVVSPTQYLTLSGLLFKNLESNAGDVFYRPPLMSKRKEDRIARRDIVKQARHVERYSEHIRGGIDKYADMVAGASLRVHPQPNWDVVGIADRAAQKKLVSQFKAFFQDWAYDSRLLQDAEGHYNFGGMMWLAARNKAGPDAECAGVIHYDEARAAKYNHKWATFVTILDPDRIATPPELSGNEEGLDPTKPVIFEGKQLDEHGRAVVMHVRKAHPGDYAGVEQFVPVPRETRWGRPMFFHYFTKTRGGQQRGVSSLVTILRPTGMMDTLDNSMIAAAVVNSMLATYIKTTSSSEEIAENLAPGVGKDGELGNMAYLLDKIAFYEKSKFRTESGSRIPVMAPDDEIVMTAVDRAMSDPTAFRNVFLRQFASAIGVSYEQLSGNYSDTNYSSARAAILDIWRGVMKERTFFSQLVASPIYGCVIEEAIAKGWIVLPAGAAPFQENRSAYIQAAWTGPSMGQVDPLKEANATKIMSDLKVKSRQRIAAEDGDDWFEIIDEIADEEEYADDLGVELDPPLPGQAEADAAAGDSEAGGIAADGTNTPKTGD